MEYSRHGGGCCGIQHVRGFGSGHHIRNADNWRGLFNNIIRRVHGRNCGRLLEVVLTDTQIRQNPFFLTILQEEGFKIVNRFRNSNSGNNCTVFHQCSSEQPLEGIPFEWRGARQPAEAPTDAFRVGDRVRVTTGLREGQLGLVKGTYRQGTVLCATVRLDTGITINFSTNSLENLTDHGTHITEGVTRDANNGPVTMWRNAFADGRRGGWYFSREEARQAAPRCRHIERGVFYNNGPVVFTEEANNEGNA